MGMAQAYTLRLNQVLSSILTCTWLTRFSQMRGGLNITCGPISRMSCCTVSGASGKLMVKPICSPQARDIICSPIQASGRKETNSSSGSRGSTFIRLRPMLSRLRWVSMASLGLPVVPEVVDRMAMSLSFPSRTRCSNQPGFFFSNSRPSRSTSGKYIRKSSV